MLSAFAASTVRKIRLRNLLKDRILRVGTARGRIEKEPVVGSKLNLSVAAMFDGMNTPLTVPGSAR